MQEHGDTAHGAAGALDRRLEQADKQVHTDEMDCAAEIQL